MEGSRARVYYRSLGLSSHLVSQYDILQGYLQGKKLFPEWNDQLDRSFAVLSDPHLKSVYDVEGSRGLQTEWCELRLQNIMRKLNILWAKRCKIPTSLSHDNKGGVASEELMGKATAWVSDKSARSSIDVEEKTNPALSEHAVNIEPSLIVLESSQPSNSTISPRAFKRSRSSNEASPCTVTQSPSHKEPNEQFCIDVGPKLHARACKSIDHAVATPPVLTEVYSTFADNLVNTSRRCISGSVSNCALTDPIEGNSKVLELKQEGANVKPRKNIAEVNEVKSPKIIYKPSENMIHKVTINKVLKNPLKQSVSETNPETNKVYRNSSEVLNLACSNTSEKQSKTWAKSFINDKSKVINNKKTKVLPDTEITWPKNFPSTAWKLNL